MSQRSSIGISCPGAVKNRSLRSLVRDHLMEGDTTVLHGQRIVVMSQDLRRAKSVRKMTESIHRDLENMTFEEAKSNPATSGTPSMNLRRIGDKLYGTARGLHCHAGIYRTRGAYELLSKGGLTLEGKALVHFEHTIPSGLLLKLMWRLHQVEAYPKPADLLTWLLRHSVVTIALQSERDAKGNEPVALGRSREIGERMNDWRDSHPDLLEGMLMSDVVRPFRRYIGTGVEVIHYPTGQTLDLENETIATHAARISTCPLHNISTYFPERFAAATSELNPLTG